jgi:chemotaxis signal transduction protein
MANRTRGYLVVRVEREWYGIPVDAVIEVLHMVALNQLPESVMLGVITLRDRSMKVFDLRQPFGITPAYQLDTPIVAVNTPQGAVGLVVDEAESVIHVVADTITSYDGAQIEGVFRLGERLIFVLQPDRLGKEAHAKRKK